MIHHAEGVQARAGTLVLRLAALLLLTAAGLFALLAFAIGRLDVVGMNGDIRYVVPGSHGRATLDPAVVVVLGACGALLGAAGLAGLAYARTPLRGIVLRPSIARPRRSRRRPYLVLVAGLLLLAAAIAMRWHGA